jgi:PhnB protein
MSSTYKPQGMPDLIPYLTVQDADRSVKFYKEAFGFEVIQLGKDENNKTMHVEMRRQGAIIMFCQEGAFGSTSKSPATQNIIIPVSIYVYCPDVDKLYNQAVNSGAVAKAHPSESFWGDRFCILIDPDGYEWSFATHLGGNEMLTRN